jgi:protein-disulfide isomerase
MRVRRLLLLFLAAGFLGSCRGGGPGSTTTTPPATTAAAAGSSAVAATVDGQTITLADVDARAGELLVRVRQQEYDARKQALDALIAEKVLEKEARSRGISPEQLLKDEVDRQVVVPSGPEVAMIYEQNQGRFGRRTRAEAEAEIRRVLEERARAARRETFVQKLSEKAQVAIVLDPPRQAVGTPASAPSLGPSDAKVKIVGFADYQCPYCHRAQTTLDQVMKAYSGKVQFTHRDFPLDGHPEAMPAARAARCAGEQGRFWEYHRGLMLERGDLSPADLRARAQKLKLEVGPFESCVASGRYDASIREGLEDGMKLGVSATPAFFVNGRLLMGAQPYEAFVEVIESELKRSS